MDSPRSQTSFTGMQRKLISSALTNRYELKTKKEGTLLTSTKYYVEQKVVCSQWKKMMVRMDLLFSALTDISIRYGEIALGLN